MRWTNDRPTEPGYYWFQRRNGRGEWVEACIEYVPIYDLEDQRPDAGIWFGPQHNRIRAYWVIDPGFYQPGKVPEQWARWSGPIKEPTE